jgi:hypothetical protein
MIKLSIIIPYYDTYNYTIKLLRELQIQLTDEVEVILVDDGCNETRFDQFKEFKITVQAFGVQTFGFSSCLEAMAGAFAEHFENAR